MPTEYWPKNCIVLWWQLCSTCKKTEHWSVFFETKTEQFDICSAFLCHRMACYYFVYMLHFDNF